MNDETTSPAVARAGCAPQPRPAAAARAHRPRLWEVLFAPWRHILRPHRAAAVVLAVPDRAAAVGVIFALAELTLAIWFATQARPAETWQIALVVTLGLAWMSWVQLPQIHRTGSLPGSYWRSVRACSAAMGFLTAEVVVLALLIRKLHGAINNEEAWDALLVALAVASAAHWLDVAAQAGRCRCLRLEWPPVCENCGYDLTHRPADGRCPECGFDIAESLAPRPGSSWANHGGVRAWLATSAEVVLRPGFFYQRLRLRSSATREHDYARWTYRAIALGAATWISCVAVCAGIFWRAPLPVLVVMLVGAVYSIAAAVGCWCGHRTIAAGAFTWWAVRNALPDGRWAAKVIAYESAFLWVFCSYWGVLITTFLLFGDWISNSLMPGSRWFAALPAEAWVVVLGTCGLGAVWLWRYRIAYRAIRWSNS